MGTQIFKQRGSAFILFITVLVLGGLSILLTGLNQGIAQKTENKEQTIKALADAKAALIGHALSYAETHLGQPPGYLLCPDQDGDGDADAPCGSTGESIIGFFPWKTLGLPPLRDGNGDCLWYAVSGTYKNSPKQALDNDTDGLFRIKDYKGNILIGKTSLDQAIAVLFSPGIAIYTPTTTQSRGILGTPTECGSSYATAPIRAAQNFLEISVAGPGLTKTVFDITAGVPQIKTTGSNIGSTTFNDTVLAITPTDFIPVYRKMSLWVAEKVRICLNQYTQLPSNVPTKNLKLVSWTTGMNAYATYYYADVTDQIFGRIPTPQTASNSSPTPTNLANTFASNPNMSKIWAIDPDTNNKVGAYCFDESQGPTYTAGYWWWWTKWKEQVFISVNTMNTPAPVGGAATRTSNGLSVQQGYPVVTASFPASFVVLVGGRRLTYIDKLGATHTQQRVTDADKSNITNYLEPYYKLNYPSAGQTTGYSEITPSDTVFLLHSNSSVYDDIICTQDKCYSP